MTKPWTHTCSLSGATLYSYNALTAQGCCAQLSLGPDPGCYPWNVPAPEGAKSCNWQCYATLVDRNLTRLSSTGTHLHLNFVTPGPCLGALRRSRLSNFLEYLPECLQGIENQQHGGPACMHAGLQSGTDARTVFIERAARGMQPVLSDQ